MLRPINDFIAVKVEHNGISKGGIVLPEEDKTEGIILAVNKNSKLQVGRRVKLQEHRGVPFKVTPEMGLPVDNYVLLVKEDKIYGYLDD